MLTAETAQAFTTNTSDAETQPFVRVIEMSDRRDKQVYTMIDGVKKWAKEPYPPPYPTHRFYPYFYFAFYEVDGERHAQSLSWRLYKLQDEYSSSRSNFRFNTRGFDSWRTLRRNAVRRNRSKKDSGIEESRVQALRPSDPGKPLADGFAAKRRCDRHEAL